MLSVENLCQAMNLGAAMAVVGGGDNFHSYISGSLEQLKKRRLNDSKPCVIHLGGHGSIPTGATIIAMSPLPTDPCDSLHLPQSPGFMHLSRHCVPAPAESRVVSHFDEQGVLTHMHQHGADAPAPWKRLGGGAAAMLTPKQQKNVESQGQTLRSVFQAQSEQLPEMVAAPPPQGEEQVFQCMCVSVSVSVSVSESVSVGVLKRMSY